LKQYVGLGVDPSKKKVLCCSDTAGDAATLFVWIKTDLKDINREAIQNDCLRFRESVRSRNLTGSMFIILDGVFFLFLFQRD
jgi:hypothetical protein